MNQELIPAVDVTGDYWVCVDCMEGIEGFEEANTPAQVTEDALIGIAWAVGNDTGEYETEEFSWNPCDCCGSKLGGERHAAVTVRYSNL